MRRIYPPVYGHLWLDGGMEDYLRRCYREEAVLKDLRTPGTLYEEVLLGGRPVGILQTVSECPRPGNDAIGQFKLYRIYLDPDTHGRGLGTHCMHRVRARARALSAQNIWLEAMDTQRQALRFYRKHGFETAEAFTLDAPLMKPEYRGMLRLVSPAAHR